MGVISAILKALGAEFAALHDRTRAAHEESDPRTTTEILAQWEKVYGLPLCAEAPTTIEGRRAALAGRVAAVGGQSREYFIGLIRTVLGDPGAAVTIIEAPYGRPFYAWLGHAWDPLGAPGAMFVWRVILPSGTDPELAHLVGCLLNKYKPAHTRLELVSDVSAYYESLDGDGNSYLETSTPIASRLVFSGTGTVNEFTLLMWVAQLDSAGRYLVRIGELSEDAILADNTDRDTHGITNYRTSFGAVPGAFAMPDDASYHLVEVSTPGGSAALVKVYVDGVLAGHTGLSPGSYPNPADVMRLLEFGGAARVRNIGMTGREITADERVALAAAGYRHDYRARYETDDGKVWAGEVLPFMWCTAASYDAKEVGGKVGMATYLVEAGETLYATGDVVDGSAALLSFWVMAELGAGLEVLVRDPAGEAILKLYTAGDGYVRLLHAADAFIGTWLPGTWHHVVVWWTDDELFYFVDGALDHTITFGPPSALTGGVTFGSDTSEYVATVTNIAYVRRTYTHEEGSPSIGIDADQIADLYAKGREHRIDTGNDADPSEWPGVDPADLLAYWIALPVMGVVPSSGSVTHDLTYSSPPWLRVRNSGSAGECDLTLIGDTTSEED